MTAQQPSNNVVRTAVEALAAVLGGTNSLHTNALDETLALPTVESAEIALRTQQVLAEEIGVTNVIDPLGGSWYVEALTDRLEVEAETIFAAIEKLGADRQHPIGPITSGLLRGVEDGWFTGQIADAAFRYQSAVEDGTKKIVGVNCHTSTVTGPLEILRVSHEVETEQCELLRRRRASRDQDSVDAALAELVALATKPRSSSDDHLPGSADLNLIEPMLSAVRAEATLGEICGALREVWGSYTEPANF